MENPLMAENSPDGICLLSDLIEKKKVRDTKSVF